jgi:murein DD-endopeptidase MepM/ murein hydrolase activator NlpD
MKRRERYGEPSLPPTEGRPTPSPKSSRYLAHLFVVVIILGVGMLVAPRFLSQPEATVSAIGNARAVNSLATPPSNIPPTAIAIVGGLDTPDPNIIRRDYVPNAAPGAAVVSVAVKRQLNTYTVVEGDTLFGIALKVGLRPETVLWSNYKLLKDNPDLLSIGQVLTIPPQDGLIVEVETGDTVDGLARRFGVSAEDIASDPINGLHDVNQPLQIGQLIYVVGGERETVVWQIPKPVATGKIVKGAKVYSVGRCGDVAIPQLGSGVFSWPDNRHYLSGYNFSAWHAGLDIAGRLGEPIFAADAGTVIYAGYALDANGQPKGYGQYVVLDHGNGYQTLYAHASQLFVRCGQQVRRGAAIAAVGSVGHSTGPHLHFEIRLNGGAVNPWTLLPQ